MSETLHQIGPFTFTTSGVQWHGHPTFDQWSTAFAWARKVEGCAQFWLGDLLNYGEHAYGEKYTQVLDATGYAYATAKNVAYVARHVAPAQRRVDDGVPFSHHAEVAALPPAKQDTWLQRCVEEQPTRDELRSLIRMDAIESNPQASNEPVLWVVVSCSDAQDQTALYNRMLMEGRIVKLQMTKTKETNDDAETSAHVATGH